MDITLGARSGMAAALTALALASAPPARAGNNWALPRDPALHKLTQQWAIVQQIAPGDKAMARMEFDSADRAIAHVSGFLGRRFSELPPSQATLPLTARDLLSIWAEPEETVQPGRSRPAHIASLRWVNRDDDLKLLDSILDGLKASAGAGFFILGGLTVTATAVAAAGLLAGILKLAYNALSKGAILSPRDYSVIAALFGQTSGLTDQQILDRLLSSEQDWTLEQVREHLEALGEIPSRSGKISLVWKSTNGRWRTAGV
jgi:hypothetical protein